MGLYSGLGLDLRKEGLGGMKRRSDSELDGGFMSLPAECRLRTGGVDMFVSPPFHRARTDLAGGVSDVR